MKRTSYILAIGLALCLSAVWSPLTAANLDGHYKTITLDGSLSDFDSNDILYTGTEIGAGTPTNTAYTTIYQANDSNNLYIGLACDGSGGGSISNTWSRSIFFDTDMNSATGYDAGWMTGGYDLLVQYGNSGTTYSVFSFSGASQSDWSWNWQGLINYSYSDSAIELSIPMTYFSTQARVEYEVTGTGVTSETWASAPESAVSTYTFAQVPEPATFALVFAGVASFVCRRKK